MMLKIILSICVMTTIVQSAPKPCCFPDQWEASEGILSGSSDDEGHSAITMGVLNVAFDAKNERIHSVEQITTGGVAKMYTVLQLYNDSVQYVIQNTTCTRSKLGPWSKSNCIPDNATVGNTYRLGQNQSIMVTDWNYNMGAEAIVMTVTSDMCVPVLQQRIGQIQGVNVMLAAGIQGITPGIKDAKIFDVPAICNGPHVALVKRTRRSFFERYF